MWLFYKSADFPKLRNYLIAFIASISSSYNTRLFHRASLYLHMSLCLLTR